MSKLTDKEIAEMLQKAEKITREQVKEEEDHVCPYCRYSDTCEDYEIKYFDGCEKFKLAVKCYCRLCSACYLKHLGVCTKEVKYEWTEE